MATIDHYPMNTLSISYPLTIPFPMPIKDILWKNAYYLEKPNSPFQKKILRQYTLTCEQDLIDINQGFCPYYASYWSEKDNRRYWDQLFPIRYRPEYIQKIKKISQKKIKKVSFSVFREIIPIENECNAEEDYTQHQQEEPSEENDDDYYTYYQYIFILNPLFVQDD